MEFDELPRLAREAPRDELPGMLGRLAEAEAVARLRLSTAERADAPLPTRLLDASEAAVIVGVSPRWLLSATRGLRFRRDLTRKKPRFDEAGLRAWLAERRR